MNNTLNLTCTVTENTSPLTATLLPDMQRLHFWPQHFGGIAQWILLEPRIFARMDRLCEDYCGGVWQFYTLSN
ncbi:antirestriction protein, partial [Citrobacter sp. VF227]